MTKKQYLERKGYEYNREEEVYKRVFFIRDIKRLVIAQIDLDCKNYFLVVGVIKTQEDIDNLQIEFNNLKQDFEECMKYE